MTHRVCFLIAVLLALPWAGGLTRQELLETIGVAAMMGGGPALMYAAHAQDAIEQFLSQPAPGE